MKKLIAVHTVRVFVGLQRCDIAPGNPLPADVEPAAIDELLALGAVKEEDDVDVVDQGAADAKPAGDGSDVVATITGDGSGVALPEVLGTAYQGQQGNVVIDELPEVFPADAVAVGNAEAPAPTPEPEVTPAPAPAAKSASKKVKAGKA